MRSETDLSKEAAAIHNMPDEENPGVIDSALGSVETEVDPPAAPAAAATPRGRPPGSRDRSKRSHKKGKGQASRKPAAAAGDADPNSDAEQLPEDFLVGALAVAIEAGLSMATASGWSSPASQAMTEKDWCSAVAHCSDALITKYFGDKPKELGEELSLGLLVLPWLAGNIWKVFNERRKSSGAPGRDGIRQNANDGGTDTGSTTRDSRGSDDGRQKLSVVGNDGR